MWWAGLSPVVTGEQLHLVDEVTAIAETTWRGTHVGTFLGVEATGRAVELPMMIVVEMRDGLMAGERMYWDRRTVLDQITSAPRAR
jgi:predicted ester cyclase